MDATRSETITLEQYFKQRCLDGIDTSLARRDSRSAAIKDQKWAQGYKFITITQPTVCVDPGEARLKGESLFGGEDFMEEFYLSKKAEPITERQQAIRSADDSFEVYTERIASPVDRAFDQPMERACDQPMERAIYKRVVMRSKVSPSGGPGGHNALASSSWWCGHTCLMVGLAKRPGMIDPDQWLAAGLEDPKVLNLCRHAKAYCDVFRCSTATVFDGDSLLILEFRAGENNQYVLDGPTNPGAVPVHISNQSPVQVIIMSKGNPLIRYCLFRALTNQLRRKQALCAVPLRIGNYVRGFDFEHGRPHWLRTDAEVVVLPPDEDVHPSACYLRLFDPVKGQWRWEGFGPKNAGEVLDDTLGWDQMDL